MSDNTVKHLAEYLALRIVAWPARYLPYRLALLLGWINAALGFFVFHFRAREAQARIRRVFEEQFSARRVRHIAWISWRNIAFSSVEMMRLDRMTLRWIRRVTDCQPVMEALKKHSDTGRGGIIAVPHMGSWELAGVSSHLHGIPIFSIAARQKNPLTDAYMNRLRRAPGIDTIARGAGTMREVLTKLKQGKMLAILPDVRVREEGIKVPFLGGEANVGGGMAAFARHANVPIFPCIVTRVGWARHTIRMVDPIWPDPSLDKEADVRRMTLAVLAIIEREIRSVPEQWFWFNRRWILDPIDPPRTP